MYEKEPTTVSVAEQGRIAPRPLRDERAQPCFADGAWSDRAYWREDLLCFIHGAGYCLERKIGVLFMRSSACTDMTGAIKAFEAFDPYVGGVITVSGLTPDTGYIRSPDGKWYAVRPSLLVDVPIHPLPPARIRNELRFDFEYELIHLPNEKGSRWYWGEPDPLATRDDVE